MLNESERSVLKTGFSDSVTPEEGDWRAQKALDSLRMVGRSATGRRGADENERLAVALGVICCKFVPYTPSKKSLFIFLHLV